MDTVELRIALTEELVRELLACTGARGAGDDRRAEQGD